MAYQDRTASELVASVEGPIATVILNRPEKKNAVTHGMWAAIVNVFSELNHDDRVRVAILRGSGDDFCAGADIAEFDRVRKSEFDANKYETVNCAAFAAIRTCRVPVVAAIRGTCFGGGFGLAAAADLRIATGSASFSIPAARLGLAYPTEAMADIVDALGAEEAKRLLFTAATMGADWALRHGFVIEIVNANELDDKVAGLARQIADNAPLSVQAAKLAIRARSGIFPADRLKADRLGKSTFVSADYAEGRTAFAERRKPHFKGE